MRSRPNLDCNDGVNRGVPLPYHGRTPADGPIKSDRTLAGLCYVVLGLMVSTSLFASIYARGLFQDGVYYLYRMAERQWFISSRAGMLLAQKAARRTVEAWTKYRYFRAN
jgi:hypothetical protein